MGSFHENRHHGVGILVNLEIRGIQGGCSLEKRDIDPLATLKGFKLSTSSSKKRVLFAVSKKNSLLMTLPAALERFGSSN